MFVKSQAKLIAKSQNIYQIVQNKYCFALILYSLTLSWSISGLFYCINLASSLAIMAAWELISCVATRGKIYS